MILVVIIVIAGIGLVFLQKEDENNALKLGNFLRYERVSIKMQDI